MRIGVPAEIKNNEHRVGLTPESVYELCSAGLAVNISHKLVALLVSQIKIIRSLEQQSYPLYQMFMSHQN